MYNLPKNTDLLYIGYCGEKSVIKILNMINIIHLLINHIVDMLIQLIDFQHKK